MTNGSINAQPKLLWVGCVLALFACSSAFCQDEKAKEISIVDPAVRAAIEAPLRDCIPAKDGTIQNHISKDGQYALYGDIFGVGREMALTQFSDGAGLCKWKDNHWETEKAWNIDVNWAPGSAPDPPGPVRPVSDAFWTIEIGHGFRVAMIAGEPGKYHQTFEVVDFNPSRGAEVVAEAMSFLSDFEKTAYQFHGYFVTYNCSPRLADYEEWNFYQIRSSQLVASADWSEYQSVNHPDDHSTTAETYGANGKVTGTFKIRDDENRPSVYSIVHGDAETPVAKVKFVWSNGNTLDSESEIKYLFHRLTGLPVDLFPEAYPPEAVFDLKGLKAVKVTGEPIAVQRLSFKK